MVAAPLVKIKDAASAGIKKISGSLKNVAKSVVIPVAIAGGMAAAALGGAVSSGMQLEQQQVSMKHFIGATNKDMDSGTVDKTANEYISALRNNANATPFETGEVISAGSRAIAIANGNTKEAMDLVKLSEDMAAASGGTKSISDAIEALADAKVGETERLKEFGFKVSAEDMKSKGFSGVAGELGDFYGGASEKLASTGAGLMSTITGKLKSNFADFGLSIVEKLKPAFEGIIGLVDKASPIMEKFGGQIAENIGNGIKTVTAILPKLISGISALKPVFDTVSAAVIPMFSSIVQTAKTTLPTILPVLQTVFGAIGSVITSAAPIISGLVSGIGTVIQTLAPVFNTVFGGIAQKVGSVMDFIGSKMGFIQEVISTVMPIVSDILTTAWNVISPVIDIAVNVFKILFSVCEKVFPGIQKVITTVWNIIKPIVEGVGNVIGGIAKGFGWIADQFTGDNEKVGANAKGTNNWRGGATWVGEKGAELIDLPKGTRILPHKESVKFASGVASQGYGVPKPVTRAQSAAEKIKQAVHITIAKLADSIIVREDTDIDKIGKSVTDEVAEALKNLVLV